MNAVISPVSILSTARSPIMSAYSKSSRLTRLVRLSTVASLGLAMAGSTAYAQDPWESPAWSGNFVRDPGFEEDFISLRKATWY